MMINKIIASATEVSTTLTSMETEPHLSVAFF